jgi:hypothetical protein
MCCGPGPQKQLSVAERTVSFIGTRKISKNPDYKRSHREFRLWEQLNRLLG